MKFEPHSRRLRAAISFNYLQRNNGKKLTAVRMRNMLKRAIIRARLRHAQP